MRRFSEVTVAIVGVFLGTMTLAVSACGGDPVEGTEPSSPAALTVPYPSDPDTLVTFSVARVDENGALKITSHGQIAKGAQWEKLFGERPAGSMPTFADGLEVKTSAIGPETCWQRFQHRVQRSVGLRRKLHVLQ